MGRVAARPFCTLFILIPCSSPEQALGSSIEGVGMVVVGRSTAATRVVLWEGASATGVFSPMDTVRSGLMGDNRSDDYSTRRRALQGNRRRAFAAAWGVAGGGEHNVCDSGVFGADGARGVE